jgi:hypothetical protein
MATWPCEAIFRTREDNKRMKDCDDAGAAQGAAEAGAPLVAVPVRPSK